MPDPHHIADVASLQRDYRPAVCEALTACVERFGDRLRAIYLSGSVAFGEAWLGASDVDFFGFLSDKPTDTDDTWRRDMEKALAERHPQAAKDFHVTLRPVAFLKAERQGWKFILRHNAVRLHGGDFLSELEADGVEIARPGPESARNRLGFAARGLAGLKNGKLPGDLFGKDFPGNASEWPDGSYLITRRLARYFVGVEGAYVLMSDGEFQSFRLEDVLRGLEQRHPEWRDLATAVRRVATDPFDARVSPRAFADSVIPFVEWAHDRARTSNRMAK